MCVAQRVVRLLVSPLHDRYSHAGDCTGLPSNTVLFLSTGNKYLFCSFNTILSLVTLDHCTCFYFLVSGVKISQPKFLIYASLHHRLQFFKLEHRYFLMNFHVVQFEYGCELIRLTYSQFVQTFQNIIRWNLLSLMINFRPISYRIPEHVSSRRVMENKSA